MTNSVDRKTFYPAPITKVPTKLEEAASGEILLNSANDLVSLQEKLSSLYRFLGEITINLSGINENDFDRIITTLKSHIEEGIILPPKGKTLNIVFSKPNTDTELEKMCEISDALKNKYQDHHDLGKTRILFSLTEEDFNSLRSNILMTRFPHFENNFSPARDRWNNIYDCYSSYGALLYARKPENKNEYPRNFNSELLSVAGVPAEYLANVPSNAIYALGEDKGIIELYRDGFTHDQILEMAKLHEGIKKIGKEGDEITIPQKALRKLYEQRVTLDWVKELYEKSNSTIVFGVFLDIAEKDLSVESVKKFGSNGIRAFNHYGLDFNAVNDYASKLSSRLACEHNSLLIMQNIPVEKANEYAELADQIYSGLSLLDMISFNIPIEKVNKFAEKYAERFQGDNSDRELMYLLRGDIDEAFIDQADKRLSGMEIVLLKSGIVRDNIIEARFQIPELSLDKINIGFQSGFSTEDLKRFVQEYKNEGVYEADEDTPNILKKEIALCLVSGVPARYFKENQDSLSAREILDKYNRERLGDKTSFLTEKLGIKQFNKLPVRFYEMMHEVLNGGSIQGPIAVYLVSNQCDSDNTILFSAWSEALSLVANYNTFIVEHEDKECIAQALEKIKLSAGAIDGLVFSYHGNNNDLFITYDETLGVEDSNIFSRINNTLNPRTAEVITSACNSSGLSNSMFEQMPNITKMYAPTSPFTYGCIVALPTPIFFESSIHLKVLQRNN